MVDALKGGSEKLTKALAEHGVVLEEGIAWIQREAAWREEGMQVYRAIVLDSLHSKMQGLQSSCRSEMPSAWTGDWRLYQNPLHLWLSRVLMGCSLVEEMWRKQRA